MQSSTHYACRQTTSFCSLKTKKKKQVNLNNKGDTQKATLTENENEINDADCNGTIWKKLKHSRADKMSPFLKRTVTNKFL